MTLQQLRLSVAMTQAEVGVALRVSPTTVTSWETGRKIPRLINIRELAHIYSVTIAEINAAIEATQTEANQQQEA